MNFKQAAETFLIVSYSTRDSSPRDLYIMNLVELLVEGKNFCCTFRQTVVQKHTSAQIRSSLLPANKTHLLRLVVGFLVQT